MNYIKNISILLLAILAFSSDYIYAHGKCKIKDQDGSSEAYWCRTHGQNQSIRCYAEVEYSNGEKEKIWGRECYSSYGDCWWNGKGAFTPYCAED